jgi:hypothetical protein
VVPWTRAIGPAARLCDRPLWRKTGGRTRREEGLVGSSDVRLWCRIAEPLAILAAIALLIGLVGGFVPAATALLTPVGIIVGIPLGLVAGRATWDVFAGHLGVVPLSVVPGWLIVVLAVSVIVVANLLAVGHALAATRTKAGRLIEGS